MPNDGERVIQVLEESNTSGFFDWNIPFREFVKNPSNLRQGAARIISFIETQHPTEHMRYRLAACLALSVADEMEGKGSGGARGAAATAAPSSQRVQPQPAPVPPSVPLSLEQARAEKAAERAVFAEWDKPTGKKRFVDCDGITQPSHRYNLCRKKLAEMRYGSIMKLAELGERDRAKLGSSGYANVRAQVDEGLREVRWACESAKNSSAPCNLSPESASSPVLPSRVIARDGRRAMDCVTLETLSNGDSRMGSGGRVLLNGCSDAVEIVWCYVSGDCRTETGSSWTLQPGKSWPVSAVNDIRWGACHGANTAAMEKGSFGLRLICKAPDVPKLPE